MFNYEEQQQTTDEEYSFSISENETVLALCFDLQAVAKELGIEVPELTLSNELSLDQLQSAQSILEQAIEKANAEARESLRKMRRCPQGYKWHEEGHGWRCDGGSHFISGAEIEKYLKA